MSISQGVRRLRICQVGVGSSSCSMMWELLVGISLSLYCPEICTGHYLPTLLLDCGLACRLTCDMNAGLRLGSQSRAYRPTPQLWILVLNPNPNHDLKDTRRMLGFGLALQAGGRFRDSGSSRRAACRI